MDDRPIPSEGGDGGPERAEGFHYLRDLVAVDPAQVGMVLDVSEGAFQLGVGELIDRFDYDPETQGDSLEEMLGQIAILQVSEDPLDLTRRLRQDQDVQVSPVHAMGTMNHWATMAGTEPTPVRPPKRYDFPDPDPDLLVAAVDSGVTATIPAWLTGIEFDTPADVESPYPLIASHGVFVAGLVRLNAPDYTVRVARARSRSISDFNPPLRPVHRAGHNPSTEIDVAEALYRLARRTRGRQVAALNISLGGYADPDDPLLLPTRRAIDHWLQNFPDAPVFAPAGNRDDGRPVYPAAFDEVIGVAATDGDGGAEVVWDAAGRIVAAPNRWWVRESRNGVDLEGPSGVRATPWVRWSGSSFSTALAVADSLP